MNWSERMPRPSRPNDGHPNLCECEPCRRDATGALALLFCTAAECAQMWGWDEAKLIRLLRVCWAWERDGVIPKKLEGDKEEEDHVGSHIVNGEFQSDKYPGCPAGKVPLSVKDRTAQPFLWAYAQVRRSVDAEFSDDLEAALRNAGYVPPIVNGD